ncbi:protein FAR1-RELATED SEQUENCE 5-like isoform X2 [Diospyros lotus]|uniref:protein FAR1-RELATED SEQUENCE 5-like isoform X2 n=1 Tax=Diospyros lotus TaxID=55363 RepID=UPI00224F370D|nr:protein FAR1-RELATED SEQUENCE 5-like isoform X2 [Diospyros lotus]
MVFMEGAFSRASDSDEAERCSPVESYNPNDLTDDELSRSMDLCIGEDDKTMEQSGGNLTPPDVIEPNVGMEFDSRDEAREFYVTYGRCTGFTVRIHHNRRSRINNMVIGQDFVCSKEGFREKKYVHRKDRVLPPPPITREGCPAMLRVALRDGVKWVVTKFIKDHNHSLMSPSKVPWRGSGKHLISEVSSRSMVFGVAKQRLIQRLVCLGAG